LSGAAAALEANNLTANELLSRHQQGDWGDMDEVVQRNNEAVLQDESQLYSLYILKDGTEVLVETAGDRTLTSVYLEEDHIYYEVDTLEGYAVWAASYDKGRNPLIEMEEAAVEGLIEGLPMSSVLDMGTGTGRYALKLARSGAAVTAVDQSPEMLAVAQQAARAEGLNIDFHLASWADDLPFAAGQFDFLVCALMLSHIPDLTLAAQKFHHLLQADGYPLLTAFHPDSIEHGWRTIFDRPGRTYCLPNVSRTRSEYLETLTVTGFTVLNIIDVSLSDAPAGFFPEDIMETTGDVNFFQ
jgi:2-polyprenyl-3-methyl-5-hydroxy-6-metoxy-1,4-benzoquinol methylase